MIFKIVILLSILFIIFSIMMKKYLDSVRNEETVKTYEKMGELKDIYEKLNSGKLLSIVIILLSIGIIRSGVDIIYCLYAILVLVSFSYLSDNLLNIKCIKDSIKRQKVNDKKREQANKDIEERIRKEKGIE